MLNDKLTQESIIELIDKLKSITSNNGFAGTPEESKIITQVFLFKFLHDKFFFKLKAILKIYDNHELLSYLNKLSENEYSKIMMQLDADTAIFKKNHFIENLFSKQNSPNFAEEFDKIFNQLSELNQVFTIDNSSGEKEPLFESLGKDLKDNKNGFFKAIINALINSNFEALFNGSYDFYSQIFEYLIKDYNNHSGGAYAEYYTPQSASKIISSILVPEGTKDVTCYDPSAGSGTLLMTLADEIGSHKCSTYAQEISEKSTKLLKLNLVLNGLVHSLTNVVRGNTILSPSHVEDNGQLQKFDYIVSNPPFKMDFSDYRDDLVSQNDSRFFAGVPNIPKTDKKSMSIYSLFLQHIIFLMKEKNGKAAIVVPMGFLTQKKGIERKIREEMINRNIVSGVVCMPNGIFATTGTAVAVIFLANDNHQDPILINASELGDEEIIDKNQRTIVNKEDQEKIIETFLSRVELRNFSIIAELEDIKNKEYSLSPGQYFPLIIDQEKISKGEFEEKIQHYDKLLNQLVIDEKKAASILNQKIKDIKLSED
tara:strand:- start:1545 stop:3167 length:1623 start_codon:yes stop_codon:yes gene_type:complete